MAKTNPAQFVRQVRQEANKVTWPTRKETGFALFFLAVDGVIAFLVQLILGQ